MNTYRLLSDAVVVVHAAYIAFVVLGLVAVLLGMALGWRWTRNLWFRAVHLVMIGVVVAQSLLGIVCPLTVWENDLRRLGGGEPRPDAFIAYWAHELIFFRAPPWVFTLGYCLFGAAVLATWFFSPPIRKGAWTACRRGG